MVVAAKGLYRDPVAERYSKRRSTADSLKLYQMIPAVAAAAWAECSVLAQIAAGRRITQSTVSGTTAAAVSEAELAEFRRAVDEVRARLRAAELPEREQEAALDRVDEIEEAISADRPNVTTMQYVWNWFRRHLPALAGSITGLIVHPVVGKIVEAAGDLAAQQFREQVGGSSEP